MTGVQVATGTSQGGSVGAPEDRSGAGFTQGSGSPLADHNLFLYDMLPRGYLASLVFFINLNKTRGVNNASDVNLAFLFPDGGAGYDFETLFGLLTSGSSAGMDTPAWWNMGHRPAKFIVGEGRESWSATSWTPRAGFPAFTAAIVVTASGTWSTSSESIAWMATSVSGSFARAR